MKYRICGAWPVGQYLIPSGAVLDFDNPGMYEPLLQRTTVPPLNSVPLDQEAWTAMNSAYSKAGYWLGQYQVRN